MANGFTKETVSYKWGEGESHYDNTQNEPSKMNRFPMMEEDITGKKISIEKKFETFRFKSPQLI